MWHPIHAFLCGLTTEIVGGTCGSHMASGPMKRLVRRHLSIGKAIKQTTPAFIYQSKVAILTGIGLKAYQATIRVCSARSYGIKGVAREF